MFMRQKKILIAQGGGPTMVINKSLVGIVEQSKKQKYKSIGAYNGVNGIINSKFINLDKISQEKLNIISSTPGAALGSTRDKPDEEYCTKILEIIKKNKIDKFFYIGGNDSSDSLRIISEKSNEINYPLQCIHVPKTIDNDLVLNDHTPGFGSASKYVASVFAGINLDVKSLPGVYIGVVMGRHAGFLTASSSLLKKNHLDGPNFIYLPECDFDVEYFLSDVENFYRKYGRCIIAVSEGIHDANGVLIVEKLKKINEKDSHGNVQLSGSGSLGDYLSNLIKTQLGIKRVRADTLGYMQRSFLGFASEIDQKEAHLIGKDAVKYSSKMNKSFSICIKERKLNSLLPYSFQTNVSELVDIAGKTKLLHASMINQAKNNINKRFLDYALPLIGKQLPDFSSLI